MMVTLALTTRNQVTSAQAFLPGQIKILPMIPYF